MRRARARQTFPRCCELGDLGCCNRLLCIANDHHCPLHNAHPLRSHKCYVSYFFTTMYLTGDLVSYDCPTLGRRVFASVVGPSLAGPQFRHIRCFYAIGTGVINNQDVPNADVVRFKAVVSESPRRVQVCAWGPWVKEHCTTVVAKKRGWISQL